MLTKMICIILHRSKSVGDIRELFHIENDFTPEEEVLFPHLLIVFVFLTTGVLLCQLAMQVERSEIENLYNVSYSLLSSVYLILFQFCTDAGLLPRPTS